jgi:putative ABC transport system permease protein
MTHLWRDIRLGLRSLVKSPGFTAIAVITLALGIGANTAIFSIVDAELLHPLPYPQPGRLVAFYTTDVKHHDLNGRLSYSLFEQLRPAVSSQAAIAGYVPWPFTITNPGQPKTVLGVLCTGSFFRLLGVRPWLGRFFNAADRNQGQPAVLVSEDLWRKRLNADPEIAGKTIELDHRSYTVLGVVPASARFPILPSTPDVWMQASTASVNQIVGSFASSLASALPSKHKEGFDPVNFDLLEVIGRLSPDATLVQVNARAAAVTSAFVAAHPHDYKGVGMRVGLLEREVQKGHRKALLLLLGAVGLVLLIACANVASLLLARATARQREMALRLALGAGKGAILRQMIVESLELAVVGGAVGAYLADLVSRNLPHILPHSLAHIPEAGLSADVLLFTAGISALAGLIFGSLPAWGLADLKVYESLKEGGRGTSGAGSGKRLRGALVVAEVALAVVLLAGSGLLLHSLIKTLRVDPGYNPRSVLLTQLQIPTRQYPKPDQWRNFVTDASTRLRAIPGVEQVASTVTPPLGPEHFGLALSYSLAGHPLPENEQPSANLLPISPGYLQLMDIPLLRGRGFNDGDQFGSTKVCVVTRDLAENEFGSKSPLGKQLVFTHAGGMCEIVGEAGNVIEGALTAKPHPSIYVPYTQFSLPFVSFVLRASLGPSTALPEMRDAIHAAAPGVHVDKVYAMEDLLRQTTATERFQALLVGMFAALATLLAAVGISGVLSYSISRRTQEIGVRMALGATPSGVLRQVVGEGLRLVGIGGIIGLGAALGLTRLMRNLLFGVGPGDALTYIGVALLLLLVALLACALPARRAAKTDPSIALRYE